QGLIKVSTRTESRLREISVDDIGDHLSCFLPGAWSLATVSIPVTNTSQFSVISPVATVSHELPPCRLIRRSTCEFDSPRPTRTREEVTASEKSCRNARVTIFPFPRCRYRCRPHRCCRSSRPSTLCRP